MTPGERARFNSPITARQKVRAILDERLTDPHERVRHGLPEERKDKPDKEQRLSKEEREQELRDEGAADARRDLERTEEENERLNPIINNGTFVDYADKDPREIAAEEFDRMLQRVGSTGRAALTAVVNITQAIAEIAQERLDDFQDDEEEPSEQTGDDDGTDEPTDADPEHATPPGMPESHELEPTVHAAESLPPLAPGEWVRRNSLSYMREAAPFLLSVVYLKRAGGWHWYIHTRTRVVAEGKGTSRADAVECAEREYPTCLKQWLDPKKPRPADYELSDLPAHLRRAN